MNDRAVPMRQGEADAAGETLAAAFQSDPLYVAIFPDVDVRRHHLRGMFGGLVRAVEVVGEVWTTPDTSAVACWLPPGQTELSAWAHLRSGFRLARALGAFPATSRRRMMDIMRLLETQHHRSVPGPHWYLLAVGVLPSVQRRGVGTTVLSPVLGKADIEQLPCYLETQTEGNVEFYRRLGFDVVRQVEIPSLRLPMWLMLRPTVVRGFVPVESLAS